MRNLPSELQLSVGHLRRCREYKDTNDADIEQIAKQLISIGEKAALRFHDTDVIKEAAARGVRVEMRNGGLIAGKLIRGFYDHSIKTLTTYIDGIQSVLDTDSPEVLGVERTVEKIREVLMWHEFFHVLEFKELGLIGKQFPVTQRILFIPIKKPVYAVSEVCANAFCRAVMGLNHSPFIIDYLYHQASQEDNVLPMIEDDPK